MRLQTSRCRSRTKTERLDALISVDTNLSVIRTAMPNSEVRFDDLSIVQKISYIEDMVKERPALDYKMSDGDFNVCGQIAQRVYDTVFDRKTMNPRFEWVTKGFLFNDFTDADGVVHKVTPQMRRWIEEILLIRTFFNEEAVPELKDEVAAYFGDGLRFSLERYCKYRRAFLKAYAEQAEAPNGV